MDADEADRNFRRWFDRSRVIDDSGAPLVLYHVTREVFDAFELRRGADQGFHFGTLAQARMRGGSILLEVHLSAQSLKRVRDAGHWTRAQLAAARRAGHDGIVYLNRYEGIPTARIEALAQSGMLARLDTLSDREFQRVVPEARDSFIVFEPCQIKSVRNPGTWSRMDPRIHDAASADVAAAAEPSPPRP